MKREQVEIRARHSPDGRSQCTKNSQQPTQKSHSHKKKKPLGKEAKLHSGINSFKFSQKTFTTQFDVLIRQVGTGFNTQLMKICCRCDFHQRGTLKVDLPRLLERVQSRTATKNQGILKTQAQNHLYSFTSSQWVI